MNLSPIVDHGYMLGLGDDDHPQYLHLNKAAQTLQQNLAVGGGITIDGVDISAHAANVNAHHNQAHTLASHTTKAHAELTNVTAAQHHARYTNGEAITAAEGEDPFDHAGAVNIGSLLTLSDAMKNTGDPRYYRNLATWEENSYEVGTIKITMGKSWSNTMLQVRIQGYDYATNRGPWEIVVGGYNYATAPARWMNYGTYILGNPPSSKVRLGHDGTKCVILLGELTTTWSWPRVTVSEFVAGRGGMDDWETGWSIDIIDNEVGIGSIVTPTTKWNTKARAWRNGIQSINSGVITIVQLQNESYDPRGNFNTATYRFTATYSGWYDLSGMAIYSKDHPANNLPFPKVYQLFYYKNNATRIDNAGVHSSWGGAVGCVVADIHYLAASDFVDMRVWHNAGVAIELWGEEHSTYMAVYLESIA